MRENMPLGEDVLDGGAATATEGSGSAAVGLATGAVAAWTCASSSPTLPERGSRSRWHIVHIFDACGSAAAVDDRWWHMHACGAVTARAWRG